MDQAIWHLLKEMERIDMISTIAATFYAYAASWGEKNMQECVYTYNHTYLEDLYNMIKKSTATQNDLGWKLLIGSKLIK